jgi:F-type H+-transporting ATPase subunit delta
MAEITTIARPYAEALARLAGESESWARWSEMLALGADVVVDAQVAGLIRNPNVAAERVGDIVVAVCGDKLDAEGANFVRLLAENRRLAVLPEIARQFEIVKTAREGILEARISTAFELSQAQMDGLKMRLESKFGRKINIAQELDADLIGGVIIQVGDEVLDASVRGKLGDLAATLKA